MENLAVVAAACSHKALQMIPVFARSSGARAAAFALLLLMLLAGAALLSWRSAREPVWDGKTPTSWACELVENDGERVRIAKQVFVTRGVEAVPYLRRGLGSRSRFWSDLERTLRSRLPISVTSRLPREESSPEHRIALLRALEILGTNAAPAFKEISGLLHTSSCEVNRQAVVSLAAIRPPWSRVNHVLHDALRDLSCHEVRAEAATLIGVNYPTNALSLLSPLVNLLADPFTTVRVSAANAIGRIGVPARPAVPRITVLLHDQSSTVRMAGAMALRRMGEFSAPAVPDLIRLMADEDPGVRREAARALAAVGPAAEPAIEALMVALRDQEIYVQVSAIEALGGIGPAARVAVQALKEARNNNQSGVGRQVLAALARIDPGSSE